MNVARELASLLEDTKRLHPDLAKKWAEQDALEAKLIEQLRVEVGNALEELGAALRYPRISRASLERAQASLAKALSAAATIDPEDA